MIDDLSQIDRGAPPRPLLRYFGGKFQMRDWIISHFPKHQFYAEPFAGAASVLLGKKPAPRGEILNDLNGELINLFRVMQSKEEAKELQRRLSWTPYAQAEFQAAAEPSEEPVEKARRMLVRSFMGIEVAGIKGRDTPGFRMGNVNLSRFDQAGQRTFRNCAKDWAGWKQGLDALRERLANVMIYQKCALDFIRLMGSPQCLLYVDPPYGHETRGETRYEVEFDLGQQADLVKALLQTPAMVVLSGYPHAIYSPLESAGWRRVDKVGRANMSRTRRTESLWLSPSINL